ncbi:alpha-tocopherol transfer protein-like isoform X2 [Sipha flava]|uniref:Alpha-tocopherol transfer protein-like isoform X2 n=1 Tax=Sipha flava TaxID=143950 RepID=A0A8B8FAB5_9HEMI|nr:alpha-tocopherol transfer protein-like isoform X2 [Sipha flava]
MTRTLDYIYGRPKGPLPDAVAATRRLLGMTDESIRRDVYELIQWLREQPDLPNTLDGVELEWWMENYLVINKNDVNRVKENLPVYFQLKTILPEVMNNRDPKLDDDMIKGYSSTLLALIPTIMDGGRKLGVFTHRPGTPASDYNPVGIAKQLTCIADLLLAQGMDHIRLVLVMDLKTLRLGHLARYPVGILRRFFLYAWKAYPERVAQIHIINPPVILSAGLALFKPFLKAKIRKRIIIHRDIDSLFEQVPIKYMPKDYGGESPSMIELHEAWRQKIIDHQLYLKTCVAKHRVLQQT